MTKNNVLLIALAIGLASVYAIWFSDWFRPKTLSIFHTSRNLNQARARGNMLPGLMFGLRPESQLTELRVVNLSAYETNKGALPVWHLVSDSNSIPVKSFFYGQYLRGMRPAIKGVGCEELETNVTYRMFITAGGVKGQHDFELQ